MSDKYLQVSNFKYGMDTRREELSTVTGVLEDLVNSIINSGGEAEKRKKFDREDEGFPSFTHGLQDTDQGLMTFGSRPNSLTVTHRERFGGVARLTLELAHQLAVGDTITVSGMDDATYEGTFVITSFSTVSVSYVNAGVNEFPGVLETSGSVAFTYSLPAGVVYQCLLHPTGFSNSPTHATMTDVLFSSNYNGKAFVVASYTDLRTFLYYDGTLVAESRNGIVLYEDAFAQTSDDLKDDLVDMVNAVEDWNASSQGIGIAFIDSPSGVHFEPVVSKSSAAGLISKELIAQNGGGTAGYAARTNFQLSGGGPAAVLVEAPSTALAGTPLVDLMGGTVAFTTNLVDLAAEIADAINAKVYETGYTADALVDTVTVFAPVSFGAFAFDLVVTITGAGTLACAAGVNSNSMVLMLDPQGLDITWIWSTSRSVYGVITASTTGANGAVTFAWSETDATGLADPETPSGILMFTLNTPSNTFLKQLDLGETAIGYFKCVATDAGGPGNAKTKYFTVKLTLKAPSAQSE